MAVQPSLSAGSRHHHVAMIIGLEEWRRLSPNVPSISRMVQSRTWISPSHIDLFGFWGSIKRYFQSAIAGDNFALSEICATNARLQNCCSDRKSHMHGDATTAMPCIWSSARFTSCPWVAGREEHCPGCAEAPANAGPGWSCERAFRGFTSNCQAVATQRPVGNMRRQVVDNRPVSRTHAPRLKLGASRPAVCGGTFARSEALQLRPSHSVQTAKSG